MIKDEFTVAYHEGEESIRIDKYLPTCYEDMTRSELKKYFDENKIKVNGKLVKPSYKVENGDLIEIEELDDVISSVIPEKIDLDIV